MTTINKILETAGDIEGIRILITIDEQGGIQVMNEETVVTLLFGDERAEEPYLEVRCHLDFIAYFCRLLGIPIKFKGLNKK